MSKSTKLRVKEIKNKSARVKDPKLLEKLQEKTGLLKKKKKTLKQLSIQVRNIDEIVQSVNTEKPVVIKVTYNTPSLVRIQNERMFEFNSQPTLTGNVEIPIEIPIEEE